MARTIKQLTQDDIQRILAEHYGVPLGDVDLTIYDSYHGNQLDSSPGYVTAEVEVPDDEKDTT